jgi:hypothetical protein
VEKSGFCEKHLVEVKDMREKYSQYLRVKCPIKHEDCHRIVRYRAQICQHHRSTKVEENREEMTEEEEDELIQKLIEEKIQVFVNNGIEVYGGVCIDVDRRLSIHLNELKHHKGFNRFTLECIPLITCVGEKAASRLERKLIYALILNDDPIIRRMCLNASK